jgi:uncharacterized Zn finger protein
MNCFQCGSAIEIVERVGFRDVCAKCERPLHACLNCGFYDPAYSNQCRETQAPRVVAKDRANFCEYFVPTTKPRKSSAEPSDARTKLDALFKKK